jgi:surface protein
VSSPNLSVTLPVTGSVNVTIDWNDGNTEPFSTDNPSHTYAAAGNYMISLNGAFTNLNSSINDAAYNNGLIDFAYNTQIPELVDFSNAFSGVTTDFTMSIADNTVTINVTNMSNMFYGASLFNKSLTNLNTSSVTNMSSMFNGASAFNQDLSALIIANLTDASNMLDGSALSTDNYNNLLIGWASQTTIQVEIPFGAANISYNSVSAKSAHDYLTTTQGWSITDGGYTGVVSSPNILFTVDVSSSDLSITLPVTGSVNVTIDWNDGNSEPFSTNNPSHTYATAGTYIISLSGTFTNLNTNTGNSTYKNGLIDFAYNIQIPELTDLSTAFTNISTSFTISIADDTVTNNVTNMSVMFQDSKNFNSLLTNLNTSSVTNMFGMFSGASAFNQDVPFNTSSVTNMMNMFYGASVFNQDLSAWNISSLTNAYTMLNGSALSTDNYNNLLIGWGNQLTILSGVAFGAANISYNSVSAKSAHDYLTATKSWSITDGGYTGYTPPNIIFTVDVSSSNLSITLPVTGSVNVTIDWNDGNTEPFSADNPSHTYATAGTYIISLSGTFTNLNSSINDAAYNNGLTDLSYNIQIPELINFSNAFSGVQTNFTISLADSIVTNNVTNMSAMFQNSSNFNRSLTNLNTSSVTNMSSMFSGATSFNQALSFTTSSVTNMSGMFSGATSFNQALSFTTSSVTNMSGMFSGATSFNQALSFTTSSVTNMSGMFSGATSFNQALSFTTSSVTNMSGMFYGATSFNQALSFITSSVTNMSGMFSGATSFNQDLSAWIIASLTDASNMLDGSGFSSNNYNSLLVGWGNQPTIQRNVPFGAAYIIYRTSFAKAAHDILTDTYNWVISDGGYTAPYPCFKEGSKILTDKGYKPIETLRSGDLIKTLKNGFKPIYKIGKRELQHPALKHRIKEQLYRFSKEKYPEIFEDLVLTGCHSVLIDDFENEQQKEKAIEINSGRLCVTDGKFRLPACLENKASIYEQPGTYTIYHIALENDDYIMNYGVFANGLLVETCSKRYLNELSGMTIL